jgi:hypothetical protein
MSEQELHKVTTDQDLSDAIHRAFSHYTLERSVAELVDRPARRRGRRPALTARALAVAAVAAAALLVATLAPGGGEDTPLGPGPAGAFASWTPEPERADAALRKAATARCNEADPRGAELPVAATERRGSYTLVFRTDGARRAVCIAGPRSQVLSVPAPPRLPAGGTPPEQPGSFPIEEVAFPGPLSPLAEQLGILVGRVGADVGAVEIKTDDAVAVTATVSRRYFVAWWPGTADDAAHATISARRHDGIPLARFTLLARDASLDELARGAAAAAPLPANVSGLAGSGQMPVMTIGSSHDDLGREIVVYLGGSERPDGTAGVCREFPTDEEWQAASPSLPPQCRYPN